MATKLPTRALVSQQDSAMIARPDVPRSRFTGSWMRLTTFNQGDLVPFLLDELLPGDHMRYDVTALLRMATPLFPIYSEFQVATFFFAVPYRLVWENWVKMHGEQANPGDTIAYTVPQLVSSTGGYAVGSIFDHFGLPTVGMIGGGATVSHSALPLRAYNLIYNEWFRDQNLQSSLTVATGSGPDSTGWYALQKRAKAHDYITSCLPWTQKFTSPTIPVGGTAPVVGLGFDGVTSLAGAFTDVNTGAAVNYPVYTTNGIAAANFGQVYADLSTATGVSINSLRQSFLIQQLLERDARGGTRYTEVMRSHFGVISPDMRMQRPEYIGGGTAPLQVTPIAQTAPSATLPVGALGAAATAAGQHSASYAATEHVMVLGLINVRSELAYQQGLHKMWSRLSRFDFYYPSLAGLGEQAVLRKELYVQGTADDELVFGYNERWQEYRTRTSEVVGLFRSTAAGTIDQWHTAERFLTAPVLGSSFIKDDAPLNRVLAAGSAENNKQFLAQIHIKRVATRPIPMFGTPVTLGRF